MQVLKLNQLMFRFMGYIAPVWLWPRMPTIIPNIMFTAFSAILMYGNIAYMLANLDNLSKATGAIYVITAMGISIGSNYWIASRKGTVRKFFIDLSTIMDERNMSNEFG